MERDTARERRHRIMVEQGDPGLLPLWHDLGMGFIGIIGPLHLM